MTPKTPTPPATANAGETALSLPIYRHVDEIERILRDHRVVVVQGPTGSGKTTQLPRILLRAGIVDGVIGVTQPRRIAAVSVAWRIAEEAGVTLGEEVGYAIRFDVRSGPDTMLQVMTDGLLLQEARNDPDLSRYGLLMVDEAHERSLNIDFTLGLLHRILQRRDDLKVVISSATLDPAVFQRFFGDIAGDVPLISVDARTHPVETVYRAMGSEHPDDVAQAVADEVVQIHRKGGPGHVLAFLSGEASIRKAQEEIDHRLRGKDVLTLPLYGRLPREAQERVFHDSPGQRKIVLSTNIAETSITIADVRHVIDTGLAKIPRSHPGTGITTLREEGISRASADQRAGRAGRTAPGRAIRLYPKASMGKRPRFTDEEILRLDLSEVALRLIALGIQDVETFPFPTPPPRQRLKAAIRALTLMDAIDTARRLTPIGEDMVAYPLSPRLARMVVEARHHFPEVLDDVLVVGAFMSGRSPWLFPQGEEVEARAAKERYADRLGDAVSSVRVYRDYVRAKGEPQFCTRNYLDPNAMAFIAQSHKQLLDITTARGGEVRGGGDPRDIVRCVARAFADNVMVADGRVYQGPGGARVAIHPSSTLFGARHRFVVSAEIVISRRTYARQVSALRPEWVAEVNPDAAHRWGIARRGRRGKVSSTEAEALPPHLELRGVRLPVVVRKGRPTVDIPMSEVSTLEGVPLDGLPPGATSWRARLVDGKVSLAEGTPLGKLLSVLPWMPLPPSGARPQRFEQEGILFELDRHLHNLEQGIAHLLAPCSPRRGRRAGWLMLVANGAEGYWFEVCTDFPDALQTTVVSLTDLVEQLPPEDPFRAHVDEILGGFAEANAQVCEAVGKVMGTKQRRRGR